MNELEKRVDFDTINKQIAKEDLDISMIRIIYEGLTSVELLELGFKQELINPESNKVLASYPTDLHPLYKDKAVGVLYLPA